MPSRERCGSITPTDRPQMRIAAALGLLVALPTLDRAPKLPLATSAHHLQLTATTLHAAALTTARASGDTTDAPYVLVSISQGRSISASLRLPSTGHLAIHLDEALGARPLTELTLSPGDSARLLVTVLEDPKVRAAEEATASDAGVAALRESGQARAQKVGEALAPLVRHGAHWIGSAVLVVTNDGGTTRWRALECVATCRVLRGPNGAAKDAGVVELTGAGGDYHLQLNGVVGN